MSNKTSIIVNTTLTIAVIGVAIVALMVFGASLGLWEPIVGVGLIRRFLNPIGFIIVALTGISFLFLVKKGSFKGWLKSAFAGLIGIGLLAPMVSAQIFPSPRFPPINDITTNTNSPPEFIVLNDDRHGARNSLTYAGVKTAEIQLKAYPDIVPIETSMSPDEAFAKALSVGQYMGWEIVAKDTEVMRYEATARTPYFALVDDVVVVVSAHSTGAKVDIRSVGRVGRSDRGNNAKRIREFTALFSAKEQWL